MYSTRSGLVLAFHGCDEEIFQKVIHEGKPLIGSKNNHDWLGHGIYFWENSPSRALDYATLLSKRPRKSGAIIKKPAVIGAIIDLGFCLDLLDFGNLSSLKTAHEILTETFVRSKFELPKNRPVGSGNDLLIRDLDCAVIETLHLARKDSNLISYDSVKGVFWEGDPLYPDAGFREKDHIQICVRNPNCIKGYFAPRKLNKSFNPV